MWYIFNVSIKGKKTGRYIYLLLFTITMEHSPTNRGGQGLRYNNCNCRLTETYKRIEMSRKEMREGILPDEHDKRY